MAPAPRKLSLLGPAGSGKTRVALRIAGLDALPGKARHHGTRVLTATLPGGVPVLLHDGPGKTLLDSLGQGLLSHADALLLVADGGDPASAATLPLLYASARRAIGERPVLILLNKRDLGPPRADPATLRELERLGPVHSVSSLTGEGLDAALSDLALRLA